MGKKGIKRRVYTQEFKSETVALIDKHEQPISQIAKDLGINENVLRKWVQKAHEAAGTGLRPFPGHGRPHDQELARLRKENKALRSANEILKKAAVAPTRLATSHKRSPGDGVPVHTGEPEKTHRQGDGRAVRG